MKLTGTLATEKPLKGTAVPLITRTREDAVKMMAFGHGSADLLGMAESASTVGGIAEETGESREFVRAEILAFADAVGALEAEGVTFRDCWQALGWTPEFTAEMLGVDLEGSR